MTFTVSNSMDDQNATSANINPNNKNTMTTTKTENTVTESGMEFHAYALLFPQANDDVLNSMAADIGKNGLREAITTFEDKILDGRNRYLACQRAGVEPHFEEYEENDPLVQDMAGEFIKDKYREKFLRGIKAVLREFGV